MSGYARIQIVSGVALLAMGAVVWSTSSRAVGGVFVLVGLAIFGYDRDAEGFGS